MLSHLRKSCPKRNSHTEPLVLKSKPIASPTSFTTNKVEFFLSRTNGNKPTFAELLANLADTSVIESEISALDARRATLVDLLNVAKKLK